MTHPDEKIQKNQEEFLKKFSGEELEMHSHLFRVGNVSKRYHLRASAFGPTEVDFNEWLEGLPDNIAFDMKKNGFEKCKGILSFTRYVNEKNDIGLDEWMKKHLTKQDYEKRLKALE